MEKFFLGVNPSKKGSERIRWRGPNEALIAWLVGLYFTKALFVGKKKRKIHRMKNPVSRKYEKKERLAVRPLFKIFIENHFDLINDKCDSTTIHRNIEAIYDYFRELRKLAISDEKDITQKKVLMDLLTSKGEEERKSLGWDIKEYRYKDIISGCSCIPE